MRTFVLAVAAALLLGSCSSDPDPIEPRSSSSAPTPSPAAPKMPRQADKGTPEGAAAFARHYVQVLNYAAETGELRELDNLSASECGGCQHYIDLYRSVYSDGGFFRDGDWHTSDYELEVRTSTTDVFVHVKADPGMVKRNRSSKAQPGAPIDGDVVLEVDTGPADRQVRRFERLKR